MENYEEKISHLYVDQQNGNPSPVIMTDRIFPKSIKLKLNIGLFNFTMQPLIIKFYVTNDEGQPQVISTNIINDENTKIQFSIPSSNGLQYFTFLVELPELNVMENHTTFKIEAKLFHSIDEKEPFESKATYVAIN